MHAFVHHEAHEEGAWQCYLYRSSSSICAVDFVRPVPRTGSSRTKHLRFRLGLMGRDAASRLRLALLPSSQKPCMTGASAPTPVIQA